MPKAEKRKARFPKLGQVLKEMRSDRYNQVEVAMRLGVSQSYVAQCESGKVEPPAETLRAFARLYRIAYRDLVAVLVREKYGTDFTAGKPARNLAVLSLERDLEDLKRRLSDLKK